MKPVALLSIFIAWLLSTSGAQGQGVRGFAAAGRSSTASAPSGASVSPSPQRATGFVGSPSAPSGTPVSPSPQRATGFVGSPIAPAPSSLPQRQNFPSHTIAPQFHRGGDVFVPPPHFRRSPRFFLGVTPRHPHRHWFFRRHPGVVFIDVAPFVDSTTVITQVAPGVLRADRRLVEESPGDGRTRGPGQLAPFDPTPQEVVERMLALAAVKKGDVIYDLGSGDGRILVTAAKKYGVHGVGFEIDAGLVKLARENARKQGVEKLVEIRQQDFLTADLSPASVVTLYLSQDGNLAVRQQLMHHLKPGARVISYTFDMAEWQPKISESYRDAAGDTHLLHLWQIAEPMVFSDNTAQFLRPQPSRDGPLIIDVQ